MSFAQIISGRNFLCQDKNVFCSNHVWEKFPSSGQKCLLLKSCVAEISFVRKKCLLLKSCVGERAAWELLVWAAVQKDPFIPIRRVRCPTQRNPVELNTIYTTLSSPPPWDINLRNHQEQAYNMPTMKILVKYGRKFLRSSCPSKTGYSCRWRCNGCKCWSGFTKYFSFVARFSSGDWNLTSVVWNAAYQHHPRERKQTSMDLLTSFQIINMML